MFDVVALKSLKIEGFDIVMAHTTSTQYKIWTRPGPFLLFETSSSGWTLLETTGLKNQASPTTVLTRNLHIELHANEKQVSCKPPFAQRAGRNLHSFPS